MTISTIVKQLDSAEAPLGNIIKMISELGDSADRTKGGIIKMSQEFEIIDKIGATPLVKIIKMISEIGDSVDRTKDDIRKMSQVFESVNKMGEAAKSLSQPYREFEQSMAELSSITGIVGDDLDHLGAIARKSGVDSGIGAKNAANAFSLLASQIQVSDIGMEGLITLQERTITLAQASGMTMEESALALSGTINQFGLQATEAQRVINVLAAGAKYGAASIPELSESFKVVGATANAAGISFEQTTGALGVLSKSNLKGAEAGAALSDIMLQMQSALGVDFTQTSMSEALTALKPKMKDAAYMAQIFGKENMAAAQFMIANADTVDKLTQQVTGTDVAQEQAATNTDTWNHSLQVQSARLDEWGMKLAEDNQGLLNLIQIGGEVSGMFSLLTPLITAAITPLVGFCSIIKGVIKGMQGTATTGKSAATGIWLKNAAVATGNGILAVYHALTTRAGLATLYHATAAKASSIWTAISAKAQVVGSAIMSLWAKRTMFATLVQGGLTSALRTAKVAMLTGVIPALAGVIASTWAWTVALLANPITWIVLGIAALVAAVVVCWEKFAGFRAVIYTIWDTIKGFGQAIIDWIIAPFKAAGSLIAGLTGAVGKVFSGDMGGAWDSLKEGFGGAADAFAQPVKDAVATANGIGGNYQMHLTEEQKKQAEKEQEKQAKQQQPAADVSQLPDMSGFDGMAMPAMPSIDGSQLPNMSSFDGMATSIKPTFDAPIVTGYEAPNTTPYGLSRTGIENPLIGNWPMDSSSVVGMDLGALALNDSMSASSTAGGLTGATATPAVTVNFQPTINISSEMTGQAKEDLLTTMRRYAPELAKIITEELRKSNRGNYGIPAIG